MLLELPQDTLQNIALYLDAPDVLSYLSVHPSLHTLGRSASFWQLLTQRQQQQTENMQHDTPTATAAEAKSKFLQHAYVARLPSVQWRALRTSLSTPSAREGHGSCVLGDKLVLTGGFTDDAGVYVKDLTSSQDWIRFRPTGDRPSFAYGASLTALDNKTAVRVGGFESGGYTGETSEVAVLRLLRDDQGEVQGVTWQVPSCHHEGEESERDVVSQRLARAYHRAIVLDHRYLLVTGGMKSRGSVLDPVVLDTHTWTWCTNTVVAASGGDEPSGRHGHSMVWDQRRHRLVLFGGGSGSDLLRSGTDNSEVWELRAPNRDSKTTRTASLLESFPWEWQRVHADQSRLVEDANDDQEADGTSNENEQEQADTSNSRLHPSEQLTLGRCHFAAHVAPETVIFCFGSGRPSCNGVLAYNLERDEFVRPRVLGGLPRPRFTAAGAFCEKDGYLFVHGGFCSQSGDAISDSCVLDLAPALDRDLGAFVVDPRARSFPAVSDHDTLMERNVVRRPGMLQHILHILGRRAGENDDIDNGEHNALALLAASQHIDDHHNVFLELVANGRIQLADNRSEYEDDDDDDGDESDEDWVAEDAEVEE